MNGFQVVLSSPPGVCAMVLYGLQLFAAICKVGGLICRQQLGGSRSTITARLRNRYRSQAALVAPLPAMAPAALGGGGCAVS